MKLNIQYLKNYDSSWGKLGYKHANDAGFDLRAAIDKAIVLKPRDYMPVPTGVKFQLETGEIPEGLNYEIQVRARSGLAAKHGISIMNGVGTVDLGYRGEVCAILVNHGHEDFVIEPGDRIAQAVVAPVMVVDFEAVTSVEDDTTRGAGGFGSTGQK